MSRRSAPPPLPPGLSCLQPSFWERQLLEKARPDPDRPGRHLWGTHPDLECPYDGCGLTYDTSEAFGGCPECLAEAHRTQRLHFVQLAIDAHLGVDATKH